MESDIGWVILLGFSCVTAFFVGIVGTAMNYQSMAMLSSEE